MTCLTWRSVNGQRRFRSASRPARRAKSASSSASSSMRRSTIAVSRSTLPLACRSPPMRAATGNGWSRPGASPTRRHRARVRRGRPARVLVWPASGRDRGASKEGRRPPIPKKSHLCRAHLSADGRRRHIRSPQDPGRSADRARLANRDERDRKTPGVVHRSRGRCARGDHVQRHTVAPAELHEACMARGPSVGQPS